MNSAAKIFSVKDVVGLLGAERRDVQRLLNRMDPYRRGPAARERRARGLNFASLVHLHVLMRLRIAGLELARLEAESAVLYQQVTAAISGNASALYEFNFPASPLEDGSTSSIANGVRISVDLQESIDAVMQYVGVAQPVQRQLPMLVALQVGARG
jgi:hypothetical protein